MKRYPYLNAATAAVALVTLGLAACNKTTTNTVPAQGAAAADNGSGPADGSTAGSANSGGTSSGGGGGYASGAATASSGYGDNTSSGGGSDRNYANDPDYGQAEYVSDSPPPALPDYDQPPLPGDGYIWTPGYWGWSRDDGDYYWTPGTWVEPPRPGVLWTPGYWRASGSVYGFIPGYWGAQVGFYGGVNYGYGYGGDGYHGGRWNGDRFAYNQTVNNITNVHVTNLYRETAARAPGRASFNGPGGVAARPTPAQLAVLKGPHIRATAPQVQQVQAAQHTPGLRASVNHGRPPIAATPRAGVFSGPGVVTNARASAPYNPPPRPAAQPARGNAPRPAEPQGRPAEAQGHPGEGGRAPAARPETPPVRPAQPPVKSEQHSPMGRSPEMNRPAQPPARSEQPSAPARPAEASHPAPPPRPAAPHPEARPAEPRPEARPAAEQRKPPEPDRH